MQRGKKARLPTASVKRQIANKALWNESRSAGKADFFTFGYSGRTVDAILESLKRHGVRTVVDIRRDPVSVHRPEMSKNKFAALLNENGIEYRHLPEFGVPREVRAKAAEKGSREALWRWYDQHVVKAQLDHSTFKRGFTQPVALMCMELDPQECHRHRLALALEGMGLKGFDL